MQGHDMIFDEALALVEEALRRAITSDVGLLSRACEYVVRSGGKRLRPKVILLSYQVAGGADISQAIPLAAAVELAHTASLIHDDINDQSDMRRGQATVNARWGNSLAILAGDFILTRVLSLIATFDSRVIRVLADSCAAIVGGETLQMSSVGNTDMTEEAYLEIVRQKTASLFSACAELGGILAGGTERKIAALKDYGLNLGIAFQIWDDTLDLVGDADELGKPVASDLTQGKMSLATLCALRRSDRAKEILLSKDLAQALQLLHDTSALEYAALKAAEYSHRAKEALNVLPGSEAKAALCELADFAVYRDR